MKKNDFEKYAKKIPDIVEIAESLALEYQVEHLSVDPNMIISSLEEKKAHILKEIQATRSKHKLADLNSRLNNITEFLESGAIDCFTELIADHEPIERVDIYDVYKELVENDKLLYETRYNLGLSGGVNGLSPVEANRGNTAEDSPFLHKDKYTKETTINRDLIDFIKQVLSGGTALIDNFVQYYNFKNQKENIADNLKELGTPQEKIEEDTQELTKSIDDLEPNIPENFRKIDLERIRLLLKTIKTCLAKHDKETLDNLKEDLEILEAIDEAQKGRIEDLDMTPIARSVNATISLIASGQFTAKEFLDYEILKYFDKGTNKGKLRDILFDYEYDLDAVKKDILQDSILAATDLNGTENLFVDELGNLRLDNISLATSVINGEEPNEEECLSADPNCLNRINYYNPQGWIKENPDGIDSHYYEDSLYKIKILQALARKQEADRLNLEQSSARSIA